MRGTGCGARDRQLVSEGHPHFAALPTLICASLVRATFLPPLADILPACDLVGGPHAPPHALTDSRMPAF